MFSSSFYKNPAFAPTPPLRFPQKLWKIANECHSGAVTWSPDGKSILLRYSLFREEFMSTKSDFFKTDNISSFVRQLNLYGFRKIYDNARKQGFKANLDLHEFSNVFFQRERPDLLDKVTRKSGILKDIKNDFWPENCKFMDESVSDDSSCDKWETNNNSSDINDHSYLSAKSEKSSYRNVRQFYEEIDVVSRVEPRDNKENISVNLRTSQENTCLSVKKKRGRKPGSKSKRPKPFYVPVRPRYLTPTLKYPERYPDLINYKDNDDDPVFVRNTSKDVMWSSTQPFQETTEYRLLKLLRDRQLSNTMTNFPRVVRINCQ